MGGLDVNAKARVWDAVLVCALRPPKALDQWCYVILKAVKATRKSGALRAP